MYHGYRCTDFGSSSMSLHEPWAMEFCHLNSGVRLWHCTISLENYDTVQHLRQQSTRLLQLYDVECHQLHSKVAQSFPVRRLFAKQA